MIATHPPHYPTNYNFAAIFYTFHFIFDTISLGKFCRSNFAIQLKLSKFCLSNIASQFESLGFEHNLYMHRA